MAINVSVQHNGGFLPDVILLTLSYYHRGTPLNAMKRFRLCSLCAPLFSHNHYRYEVSMLNVYPGSCLFASVLVSLRGD